jgi:alpha-ketoglutarate-dependent taurine dioxygenase
MEPDLKFNITPPDDKVNYVTVCPQGSTHDLQDLDTKTVTTLFRKYGAILFRDFQLDRKSFRQLAFRFCSNFIVNKARDSGRRPVSPDGRVQTVNLGNRAFPLHPELSTMPTMPDIAWFACNSVPVIGGETLLCDGIKIVSALQQQTRELLKRRSFLYKTKTTKEECESWLGIKDPDATALQVFKDKTPLRFSIEDGEYYSTYITPALHQPLFSNELAFGSFLLFARQMQGWKNFPTFEDGTEVPDAMYEELKDVSDSLTVAHPWQQADVLMVDNTRFMHGRNYVVNPEQRIIWTQFAYASFIPELETLYESQPWRRGTAN